MSLAKKSRVKVLIIDDDVALAGFLKEVFVVSEDDFEVQVVHDGFTAGSFIQSFQPDVVLIDIMMPGVNGIEVCRFLKENEDTENISIIAMTGKPTRQNVDAIMQAGARECLHKPINIAQLKHAVFAAIQ